jgi:putative transposase
MEGGMDGEELKRLTKEEISRRIREGVKAVIEQVLEEEMTEHLAAGYRERTPSRRGERNGYYTRDLITPAGRIAQLRVPRDREGTFLTEVFARYKRMTGEVEEAVLEMYLQGVSTRKVAAITEGLSRVRIGKDAVSRVAQRLEEELSAWRGRPLELAYPYLYLDAAYFKVNWGGRVVDLALLVAVGVNEEGYREVLAVEPAGGERKEAWRNLLKGLVERGLRGVRLVISDDHPSIRQAVMAELPGASWQRCVVHFMRNVLAHVPQSERGVVAEELQEVFHIHVALVIPPERDPYALKEALWKAWSSAVLEVGWLPSDRAAYSFTLVESDADVHEVGRYVAKTSSGWGIGAEVTGGVRKDSKGGLSPFTLLGAAWWGYLEDPKSMRSWFWEGEGKDDLDDPYPWVSGARKLAGEGGP